MGPWWQLKGGTCVVLKSSLDLAVTIRDGPLPWVNAQQNFKRKYFSRTWRSEASVPGCLLLEGSQGPDAHWYRYTKTYGLTPWWGFSQLFSQRWPHARFHCGTIAELTLRTCNQTRRGNKLQTPFPDAGALRSLTQSSYVVVWPAWTTSVTEATSKLCQSLPTLYHKDSPNG